MRRFYNNFLSPTDLFVALRVLWRYSYWNSKYIFFSPCTLDETKSNLKEFTFGVDRYERTPTCVGRMTSKFTLQIINYVQSGFDSPRSPTTYRLLNRPSPHRGTTLSSAPHNNLSQCRHVHTPKVPMVRDRDRCGQTRPAERGKPPSGPAGTGTAGPEPGTPRKRLSCQLPRHSRRSRPDGRTAQ